MTLGKTDFAWKSQLVEKSLKNRKICCAALGLSPQFPSFMLSFWSRWPTIVRSGQASRAHGETASEGIRISLKWTSRRISSSCDLFFVMCKTYHHLLVDLWLTQDWAWTACILRVSAITAAVAQSLLQSLFCRDTTRFRGITSSRAIRLNARSPHSVLHWRHVGITVQVVRNAYNVACRLAVWPRDHR